MVEYSSEDIGLVELKLTQLPPQTQLDLEFDTDILQRLVIKTFNLQTLEVSNVADIAESSKQELLPIVCQIIERNGMTLQHINLAQYTKNLDEGKQILQSLSRGPLNQLKSLDLGKNSEQFKLADNFEMLW